MSGLPFVPVLSLVSNTESCSMTCSSAEALNGFIYNEICMVSYYCVGGGTLVRCEHLDRQYCSRG